MSEGEYITCDEDWLDMRVGETGVVLGRLDHVFIGSAQDPPALLVRFSDWTSVAVRCETTRGLRPARLSLLPHAYVRVRRTEDGLDGIAVWEQGGVPVPLVKGGEPCAS